MILSEWNSCVSYAKQFNEKELPDSQQHVILHMRTIPHSKESTVYIQASICDDEDYVFASATTLDHAQNRSITMQEMLRQIDNCIITVAEAAGIDKDECHTWINQFTKPQ